MLAANAGPIIGQTAEEGARGITYAATNPDMEGAPIVSGRRCGCLRTCPAAVSRAVQHCLLVHHATSSQLAVQPAGKGGDVEHIVGPFYSSLGPATPYGGSNIANLGNTCAFPPPAGVLWLAIALWSCRKLLCVKDSALRVDMAMPIGRARFASVSNPRLLILTLPFYMKCCSGAASAERADLR
jgi:hypothetical protein